jgi:Glycosyl hydrolase family 20, domain 2/Glycosyl hydrolase family 20, catalytic domain
MIDYLLPTPQKIEIKNGDCLIDESWAVSCDSALANEGEQLSSRLSDLFGFELPVVHEKCDEAKKVAIVLRDDLDGAPESYRLAIDESGIVIRGADAAGVFYGIQTLLQLVQMDDRSCCEIEDTPVLSVRGIHIDLKYQMLRFDYLKQLIERLAAYKINTILIEYEDKFEHERHPDIVHPLALTKSQISELHDIACKHHIQIMPMLQSFGHSEYILRHERYTSVRELPDTYQQRCPLNPEGLELFKEMALEMMELHPTSRYIHIGGDETYQLGQCPKCRQYIEEHGKSELIVKYFNQVIDWVCAQGKIPVVFHDMLIDHPEAIDKLDKRVVVGYWEYRYQHLGEDEVPFVVCGLQDRYCIGEKVLDLPQHIRDLYKPYWDAGSYPKKFKTFPYIEFFQDRGIQVLGMPCTRFISSIYPEYEELEPNIRKFTNRIKQASELGIINTSWDSHGLPFELTWYGILLGAEYSWSTRDNDANLFDKKFATQYFGIDDDRLMQYLHKAEKFVNRANHAVDIDDTTPWICDEILAYLDEIKPSIKRNQLFLEYFQLAIHITRMIADKDGWLGYMFDVSLDKWFTLETSRKTTEKVVDKLKEKYCELLKEYERVLAKTIRSEQIASGRSFRLLMVKHDLEYMFHLAQTLPGHKQMSCLTINKN